MECVFIVSHKQVDVNTFISGHDQVINDVD